MLADVLQLFAGLEANRAARRDANFLARTRIATDPRWELHLKDASLSIQCVRHAASVTHRPEHGIHRQLGLHLGDIRHQETSFTISTLIIGLASDPVNTLIHRTYAVKLISALL